MAASWNEHEIRVWYGFYAPAKIPDRVIQKFYREVVRALENADVKSRRAAIGTQPAIRPPREFQKNGPLRISEMGEAREGSGDQAGVGKSDENG